MEPREQHDLIKGCIEGERSAQYAFYKKYAKAMYNICYRITNDADDAEDVLQEAFINAFRYMHTFKGESSIGAWLKRIVVNASISHVKKRRHLLESMADYEMEEESGPDDEELVLELDRIREAIRQLPDGFRTVFSLYLLEGYDHREIGEILGVSESTSKSQYNRAKKKLKEVLKERVYVNG